MERELTSTQFCFYIQTSQKNPQLDQLTRFSLLYLNIQKSKKMGRALEQLKDFPVWTALFLAHSISELVLGSFKLRGYYLFEKKEVLLDLNDIDNKKNKRYVENRIKLMQYTRYHALSRMTLGFIGLFAVSFDGVDGQTSSGGLLSLGLGFAFWHSAACLVVIVHLSSYPEHAFITKSFFLHFILAAGFLCFCLYGKGAVLPS
jgi:hypothetical protein